MKYLLMIQANTTESTEPNCTVEDWVAFDKEIQDAGVFVSGESLADLVTATRVQVDASGETVITDGPYAEAREVLGGFYVIDVPDLDAALDWAARCPGATDGGSIDVRPIADFA